MFLIFISVGIFFLVPYVVRNIILSGWPLYPLPVLGLNVSWAVPYEKVLEVFQVIKAWAILPGASYYKVLGLPFTKWFPGWFLRNSGVMELKIFFLSLLFFICSIFLKFFNKKNINKNIGLAISGLAALASIFYLIFSAPDFRFGGIYFWAFFASVCSFFFVGLFKKYPKFEKIFFVLSLLLIFYISWPPKFDGEMMLKSIRWEQTWTFEKVTIKPNDGSPDFEVYVPGETGSCGNSKLPCTPEINNYFKEIVPGDLSKGFAPVK